jgi:hypothetical protein
MSLVYFNYWHLKKQKEEQEGLKEDRKGQSQERSHQDRIRVVIFFNLYSILPCSAKPSSF